MVKSEFDCDFLLLKFEMPLAKLKFDPEIQLVKTQSIKMQSTAGNSIYDPPCNLEMQDSMMRNMDELKKQEMIERCEVLKTFGGQPIKMIDRT